MGINFPASPALNDLYPVPAVPGVPQYKWDGTAWLASTQADVMPASVIVSDTPPASPRDNWFWWESDTGTLHLRYNDGAGPPQWVQAAGQSTIDTSQFALKAEAATFDAMSYSGMQINGSMDISQEYAIGTALNKSQVFVLDGWRQGNSLTTGAANFTTTPIPTEVPGLKNCLQMQCTTAQPTIGSSFVRFQQMIEGYRFQRVAWGTASAKPLTVGFWARATLAGSYQLIILNFDGSAATAFIPFTLAGGPAFQWVTVQVPAVTTGTWKTDNSIGANIIFEICSPLTPNLMATAGNYFSLTGVTVLPGTQAPTAAQSPLIMRPYDQELATCQRYYWKSSIIVDTTPAMQTTTFLTPMRTTPTITGGAAGFTVQTIDFNCVSMSQTARNYQLLSFDARL